MTETESAKTTPRAQSDDDFFVPDLCNTRSVVTLILASELFALIVGFVASPLPNFDIQHMALVSLLVQWITLSSAAVICQLRVWLRNIPRAMAVAIGVGITQTNTFIFSALGQWVFMPDLVGVSVWLQFDYWGLAQNLIISAIMSSMVFRYFVVQYRLRIKESSELQARLQSLQSRIRPHFLFNSMNIIASLIHIDPDVAERVVEDLAELFRSSLKETASVVPLTKEISLCKKYLGIEQLRLGKRLEVEWREDDLPEGIEIPLLLLQPLLENAIYHGIQPLPKGGKVSIDMYCEGELFYIKVTNPLPVEYGQSTNKPKGNQMAIKNIRHRLHALYGANGNLVNSEEGGDFMTVLSLPYKVKS